MKDSSPDDDPVIAARQSRVALVLFFVYLVAYGGFMGLAAFSPKLMEQPLLAGVNVAIVYGLALIGAAVILAVLYMVLCHWIVVARREQR